MSNDSSNGRIQYLREDFQNLSNEVNRGFDQMGQQIQTTQTLLAERIEAQRKEFEEKIEESEKKMLEGIGSNKESVEENSQEILSIRETLVKVFFIGGAFGTLFGSIISAIILRIAGAL